MDYDATEGPEREAWLELDGKERIAAVRDYHDDLDDHPPAGNMRAHCMMHAVVEKQIASDEPPQTREKLEELVEAGIDRHAAIHALISPIAKVVYGVAEGQESGEPTELMGERVSQVTVEDARDQQDAWE